LYTPQHLFGEVGSSSDILAHEPFLERARLQRELEQDGPARLALGAYVVARLISKLLSIPEGEEDIEGFQWQLEAVRRHINELPSNSPETAHLAGVVAAVPRDGPPTASLWKSLTAYAYFLEHDGRLEEALEILALAARAQGPQAAAGDFVEYALSAGRLNRELARWDTAIACYNAAEQAAVSTGNLIAEFRARLGLGAVYRGQGNYPLARAAAEEVAYQSSKLCIPAAQAMAYADLGVIYSLQGLKREALVAHYKAFRLSTDPLLQMRTLSDLAMGLCEAGAFDAARLAFQIVISSESKLLVRVNALLELMDLESAVGNRVAFERCRAAAGEYRERMAPSMSVDYCYKVAMGLDRFGQTARAKDVLNTGLRMAEHHKLHAWYFKIEQALEELGKSPIQDPPQRSPSQMGDDPAVREMVVGLREYAESTAS
jgi:tetratricopeptide (TPR) repeat protein